MDSRAKGTNWVGIAIGTLSCLTLVITAACSEQISGEGSARLAEVRKLSERQVAQTDLDTGAAIFVSKPVFATRGLIDELRESGQGWQVELERNPDRPLQSVKPARLMLPRTAVGELRIEDLESGLAAEVRLLDSAEVAVEVVDGYAIYPQGGPDGASIFHAARPDGNEEFLFFDQAPRTPEVKYRLSLAAGVAGVRFVANQVELLDGEGTPRLRMPSPYIVDAAGERHLATVSLSGCAYDADPRAPWNRAVTPPGAAACDIRIAWPGDDIAYPALLDPAWTTTGSMGASHRSHAATRLTSGLVLVTGGSGTTNVTATELYDPSSGTWAATGALNTGRYNFDAATLGDGRVLVAGGLLPAGTALSSAEIYNPATGSWANTGAMSVGRAGFTLTQLSTGRALAAGGIQWVCCGATGLNTAELYNPASGTWSATGSMAAARTLYPASVLPTGSVLVSGGGDGSGGYNTGTEIYDPNTGIWSSAGNLATARHRHSSAALPSGHVIVAGGRNGGGALSSAELYEGTGTWSAAPSLGGARYNHECEVLQNGYALVVGGSTGAGFHYAATAFYLTVGWTSAGTTSSAFDGHTTTLLSSGSVLAAGGIAGTAAELFGMRANGSSCAHNAECQSGFCVDGFCCDLACDLPCDACSVAAGSTADGVCGTVPAGVPGNPGCDPFLCGGTADCPTGCSGPGDCVAGAYCDATAVCRLPSLALGEACTGAEQCVSGFCADGICCESACDGGCESCVAVPVAGQCVATAAGDPGAPSCAPYLCDGAAGVCPAACLSDANCVADHFCRMSDGTCQPDLDLGGVCTSPSQCLSASCVDGRCCSSACATDCFSCDVIGSEGSCAPVAWGVADGGCSSGNACDGAGGCGKLLGQPCTGAGECLSGFCADGVCCNGPCDGTCEACSASGSCDPIAASTDPDGECGGTPPCVGACNGARGCGYPGAGTLCGLCRACDGAGSCDAVPLQDPACGFVACWPESTACQIHVDVAASLCAGLGVCTSPVTTNCTYYGDAPDGTRCDDGNACREGGTCEAGVCGGGTLKTCAAVDECHTAGTCDPGTGVCANPAKPDGTTCSGGTCQAGICEADSDQVDGGCECSTTGTSSSGLAWMMLLGLAFTGYRRRRRR